MEWENDRYYFVAEALNENQQMDIVIKMGKMTQFLFRELDTWRNKWSNFIL